MNKKTDQQADSKDDQERFKRFWRHLRLNGKYCEAWNEYQDALNPKVATGENVGSEAAAVINRVQDCCGLPIPIDPKEDSDKAMQLTLGKEEGFFSSEHWQRIKLEALDAGAAWNVFGQSGCALSGGLVGVVKDGEPVELLRMRNRPARYRRVSPLETVRTCGEAGRFLDLMTALALGPCADRESTAAGLRSFFQKHCCLDFILDTSLAWGTVVRELEKQFGLARRKRVELGLPVDRQPPRGRDWEKHLEVYDLCAPQVAANRKKFEALQRIWREGLGFADAFKLLSGVKLTRRGKTLVDALDRWGACPAGFYRMVDRKKRGYFRRRGITHDVAYGFNDRGDLEATVDGYEAIYAALDGAEVDVDPESQKAAGLNLKPADWEILKSWREHFSIPKVRLPAPYDKLKGFKRRDYVQWAEDRIEAAWREG